MAVVAQLALALDRHRDLHEVPAEGELQEERHVHGHAHVVLEGHLPHGHERPQSLPLEG